MSLLAAARPFLDKVEPSEWLYVLGGMGGFLSITFLIFWLVSNSAEERSRMYDGSLIWLVISGSVHIWLELPFVFFRKTSPMANGLDLYAAADFRYGRPLEAGTAAMEAITALLVGPLCFLTAYGALKNRKWRWIVQVIVCTCQLYGLIWFTLHPLFSDTPQVTSDPFLFWVILVGLNGPWAIAPPLLLFNALRSLAVLLPEDDTLKKKKSK